MERMRNGNTYSPIQAFSVDITFSAFRSRITKTCLYNVDPLKPHFYMVKLGFTGVYIIFLISAQNVDCRYPLEPPRRGGFNEYPQFMNWAEKWKISEFLPENFHFLMVKFSVYLNRRVFVMTSFYEQRVIWLYCAMRRHILVFAVLSSQNSFFFSWKGLCIDDGLSSLVRRKLTAISACSLSFKQHIGAKICLLIREMQVL